MLAVYVSGHGFGHATRTSEVLRAIRERAPDLPLAVITTAPEALFRAAIPGPFAYRPIQTDVGLAQRGALAIDEAGTISALHSFAAGHEVRVDTESAWLRAQGVKLVLADIPPLAFEAASAAGVRAVGMGNFSWDWIYRHFARGQPALQEAADQAAAAYGTAELFLEMAFAGDLSAFPRREPIGLVARRPRLSREAARAALGFQGTVVLWSFGGFSVAGFDPKHLSRLAPRTVIVSDPIPHAPPNVRCIPNSELHVLGLRYNDMMAGADVVVTKPGYGIVSDAIAAGVRMVYTDRGDFPEYPIMVAEMQPWIAAEHATNAQVMEADLGDAIDRVLARPAATPPDVNGADQAASRLADLLEG